MVHSNPSTGANAWCPNCKMGFGYVIEDSRVVCPVCKQGWNLPIIQIAPDRFFCIPCQVVFGVYAGRGDPRCHNCQAVIEVYYG